MIVVGLTGSIGMGKSTVSKMFEAQGCAVFNADAAVHKLYAPGGAVVPVIKAVFPDVIKDGGVDRAVLAQYLQNDPLQVEVLESFVHPLVQQKRAAIIKEADAQGKDILIADIPLLFESGVEADFDKIVVVTAPAAVQRLRVLARPGMSEERFAFIVKRQMSDACKRKRADYVIYTDQSFEHTRQQVKEVVESLRNQQAV